MISNRRTAVAVGVLFLTATVAFATADSLIRSILSRPGFLISATEDAFALHAAALLALGCGIAVVAIALLVYPLLKDHSGRLALGYVALRVAELGPILLYAATPLLVVALGANSHDGNVDAPAANQHGLLLQALFDVALKMLYLFTGASGIIFAYLLYRTKLVPRPIVILGVIGYPVLLVGAILYIFNLVDLFQVVAQTIVYLPVGLFELILPIWLIVKGFARAPATAARALSGNGR